MSDRIPANVGPLAQAAWEEVLITGPVIPSHTDSTRGAPGTPGRMIFNTDDGFINIDDGTNWTKGGGAIT